MPGSSNGRRAYYLDFSDAVAQSLRQLQRLASRRGQGHAFAAAFRKIIRALQKDPNKAGELLYRLPAMSLYVRTIVISPLVIDFAVSEEQPIVCIKGGKLLASRESE